MLHRLALAVAVTLAPGAACDTEAPPPPTDFDYSGDGLAMTPPMGWSSWNALGCDIDEEDVRQHADALVSLGLHEVGYEYVNIDDCWAAGARGADGQLDADPVRFPSGIAALADYVHARGLKLGIYSGVGAETCNGLPGSGGFEEIDARRYADWGVDYLKYDRCGAGDLEVFDGFVRMRTALRATGRPIVFSINPEGAVWDRPWRKLAHLWRTTPDIKPAWTHTCDWWCGIMDIVDLQEPLARAARPNGWNDPDMLEVGVANATYEGLSPAESRVHMTLWAMMAAPLIAGADLRHISAADLAIYANPEIIAVDQDRLGIQGWRVREEGDADVWVKPLTDPGARAVALVNRSSEPRVIGARWSELLLAPGPVVARDLWTHEPMAVPSDELIAEVPPHDVLALRVVGTPSVDTYEAESHVNTVVRKARIMRCAACSGGQKVGYVGLEGGQLRFNEVDSPTDEMRTVSIWYATDGARTAWLSIDGEPAFEVRFPSTGGFDTPAMLKLPVHLHAGANDLLFTNPSAWAPDFDRIVVE